LRICIAGIDLLTLGADPTVNVAVTNLSKIVIRMLGGDKRDQEIARLAANRDQ